MLLQNLLTLFAKTPAECQKAEFLGFKPWYYYLELDNNCDIQNFYLLPGNAREPSSIPPILLAVVDDLLRLAGIVAVAFVIVGAIGYITSQGNPEDSAKAQSTIINALIGVAVTTVAIAFVSFIGNRIGN